MAYVTITMEEYKKFEQAVKELEELKKVHEETTHRIYGEHRIKTEGSVEVDSNINKSSD